jgi:hypothetical protein
MVFSLENHIYVESVLSILKSVILSHVISCHWSAQTLPRTGHMGVILGGNMENFDILSCKAVFCHLMEQSIIQYTEARRR